MSDIAIQAENLGKRYRIGALQAPYETLRETISSAVTSPYRAIRNQGTRANTSEFWALRDVSFEVRRGEVLGVIGRNGAGKSTLLKLLSRVTSPTTGYAKISGRVGSLLEVGTGFHPELSGRENIYLNGAILGMTRTEIARKFDEIVEFAEIHQFLDTPIKRYSTGMYMRLAFSVAAHLEPSILVVDEVLAVGDAAFQKKCLGKMSDVAQQGRTVVFVSHNMPAVQALCDRAMFISGGQMVFSGPVESTVREYLDRVREGSTKPLDENPDRSGNGAVRLTQVDSIDRNGAVTTDVIAGESISFEFHYATMSSCKSVSLGFTIYNQLGMACTHLNTSQFDVDLAARAQTGAVRCTVNRNPFPIGDYTISAMINADGEVADHVPACFGFRVIGSKFFPSVRPHDPDLTYCPVMVDHEWH